MLAFGIPNATQLYRILRRHHVRLRAAGPAPRAAAYRVTMRVLETVEADDLEAALAQVAARPWTREILGAELVD